MTQNHQIFECAFRQAPEDGFSLTGIILIIIASGVFGGLCRYLVAASEREKTNKKNFLLDGDFWASLSVGVLSASLVPLFLNSISSSLLEQLPLQYAKSLVFIGFCLAAAFFGKQFVHSFSRQALLLSEKANETANIAHAKASEAQQEAREADNRAIALVKVVQLFDQGKLQDALSEVDNVLAAAPQNADALAWKAYILRRFDKFDEAKQCLERALELEQREVSSWLYNLACYACLAGASRDYVCKNVIRAYSSASSAEERRSVRESLSTDEDLATLREGKEFVELLNTLSSLDKEKS